jgi:hypothetical protein
MDTPICSACTQPQRGIVEFRWSEGAVVYECTHCGAFNEVSSVARRMVTRPSHRTFGLGALPPRIPAQRSGHGARY